jgi:hypothetical protein
MFIYCIVLIIGYVPTQFKRRKDYFYTGRHATFFFTNNPSQLFQINPLHAYRWRNGGPARARRLRVTTLVQTRDAGLLTVLGQPVSPTAYLIKSE